MSFNKLKYDTCSYKQVLEESTGPGEYQLGFTTCFLRSMFQQRPKISSSEKWC